MIAKDYYARLGVSRTDSPAAIQAAYRDLHERPAEPLRGAAVLDELEAAFAVLSHATRRQRYDERLQRDEEQPLGIVGRKPEPEPMIPEPVSLFDSPENVYPSVEAMRQRLARNFTGWGVPKAERLEGLTLDVVLSPEEAAAGCEVPIGVPVFRTCPNCGGSGEHWLFPCVDCRTLGVIEDEEVVNVRIPPLAPAGTIIEVPLHGLGIHNFYLRLHLSISES